MSNSYPNHMKIKFPIGQDEFITEILEDPTTKHVMNLTDEKSAKRCRNRLYAVLNGINKKHLYVIRVEETKVIVQPALDDFGEVYNDFR